MYAQYFMLRLELYIIYNNKSTHYKILNKVYIIIYIALYKYIVTYIKSIEDLIIIKCFCFTQFSMQSICTYTYTYIYTYIYIYNITMYTHTHTHIYIYVYMCI